MFEKQSLNDLEFRMRAIELPAGAAGPLDLIHGPIDDLDPAIRLPRVTTHRSKAISGLILWRQSSGNIGME
jgi:hypothetical protein